jgi:hypothetical protein
MPDKITTLVELAMNSTTDAAKLAALAQAKRIYRNQGITLPKPKPVQAPTVPKVEVIAPTIDTKERETLLKLNLSLTKENKELQDQVAQLSLPIVPEVLLDQWFSTRGWIAIAIPIFFIVIVVLGMFLL